MPVSVAHGKRDRIVPVKMGSDVYEAAKVKGQLLLVDQAGHNDVAEVAGEEYWHWLQKGAWSPPPFPPRNKRARPKPCPSLRETDHYY